MDVNSLVTDTIIKTIFVIIAIYSMYNSLRYKYEVTDIVVLLFIMTVYTIFGFYTIYPNSTV